MTTIEWVPTGTVAIGDEDPQEEIAAVVRARAMTFNGMILRGALRCRER